MALGSENRLFQQSPKPQILFNRVAYQRPIAPAPLPRVYAAPYMKSKTYYTGSTLDSNNPSIIRRNARERNRVKQVNNGFINLRQHIPTAIIADLSNGRRGVGPGANKKLSKVDTLRMALEYIRRLQSVIEEVDSSDTSSVSSYNSCVSSTNSSSPLSATVAASASGYQAQNLYSLTYAASYQPQPHSNLISPAASTNSSALSSDSYYHSPTHDNTNSAVQLKCESAFDEYANNSAEDEDEFLDYISLWQDEM